MKIMHCDFETRSRCDLKALGGYVYAAHESTEILCMAYAFGEAEPELWIPDDRIFPSKVMNWIADGNLIAAHNAQFERLIFKHVLGITIPPEQFICTASLARARGLPGQLALAPALMGARSQKDNRGQALIKACCVPNKHDEFSDERLPELYEYCLKDVKAERELYHLLPPFTQAEQDHYVASERVNDRGIKVDVPFCRAATKYKRDETREIGHYLSELTDGKVTAPTQTAKITNWMFEGDQQPWQELLIVDNKRSVAKAALEALLEHDDVPEVVREVAQCRLDGANVSVSKYERMANIAEQSPGDRIRGAFMFNTAITGRFSSRGVQLHNFKRSVPENYEDLIEDVMHGVKLENVMSTLASLLRPSLVAPEGKVFVGGDWSAIEARITAWLGGAVDVLDVFRSGRDVYVDQAIRMRYTEDDRQIGKVAILACGFGGKGNAFAMMARAYGLNISKKEGDEFARRWGTGNPWAEPLWNELGNAAQKAIRNPGEVVTAHIAGVRYMMFGDWLCCELPSGRVLYYPQARLHEGKFGNMEIGYVHARYVSASNVDQPPRVRTWGGKLCENIVQAIAADLLRDAIVRADRAGFDVVGHVHDELLLEVPEEDESAALETLSQIMLHCPDWADGLPLDASCWAGLCYQK